MKILTSVSDVINVLPKNILSYDDFIKVLSDYGCEIRDLNKYDTCTFFDDEYCFEYRFIESIYLKDTDINVWSIDALNHISKDTQLDLLAYTMDKFFFFESNIYSV